MKPRSNGRGETLTNATLRKYLNAMSDLFKRAVSDGVTTTNPAQDLYSASKPKPEQVEARYWDPDQVGRAFLGLVFDMVDDVFGELRLTGPVEKLNQKMRDVRFLGIIVLRFGSVGSAIGPSEIDEAHRAEGLETD